MAGGSAASADDGSRQNHRCRWPQSHRSRTPRSAIFRLMTQLSRISTRFIIRCGQTTPARRPIGEPSPLSTSLGLRDGVGDGCQVSGIIAMGCWAGIGRAGGTGPVVETGRSVGIDNKSIAVQGASIRRLLGITLSRAGRTTASGRETDRPSSATSAVAHPSGDDALNFREAAAERLAAPRRAAGTGRFGGLRRMGTCVGHGCVFLQPATRGRLTGGA